MDCTKIWIILGVNKEQYWTVVSSIEQYWTVLVSS